MEGITTEFVDIGKVDPAAFDIQPGTFVVIVRYATRAWLRRLANARSRLTGVVYFMDDDLPAGLRNPDLPFRYRYKILRLFWVQRPALSAVCSEIRVSTRHLAEKYDLDARCVVEPLPLLSGSYAPSTVTYFYEATASHRAELRWLRDVVAAVQRQTSDLTFVTVGGAEIHRLFADIPRTLCLHPVPWPTYLQSFPHLRHDIGLAPVLQSEFNQGRSHTKFFDITRLGAAGIYSNCPPYVDFVRPGIDGLLADNRIEAWSTAIIDLACSAQRRGDVLARARERVEAVRNGAETPVHGVPG